MSTAHYIAAWSLIAVGFLLVFACALSMRKSVRRDLEIANAADPMRGDLKGKR